MHGIWCSLYTWELKIHPRGWQKPTYGLRWVCALSEGGHHVRAKLGETINIALVTQKPGHKGVGPLLQFSLVWNQCAGHGNWSLLGAKSSSHVFLCNCMMKVPTPFLVAAYRLLSSLDDTSGSLLCGFHEQFRAWLSALFWVSCFLLITHMGHCPVIHKSFLVSTIIKAIVWTSASTFFSSDLKVEE